ncbi:MAG: hypothetical protein N2578_09085, partial [Bdellovibrionaceae bacterium]|nr:hypothetical protein [Pseudobdellovibrionaceae bacterium]
PQRCVEQLGAGLKCYNDICAARAAEVFEKMTGATALNAYTHEDPSQFGVKEVVIQSTLCKGEISIPLNFCERNGTRFSAKNLGFWRAWSSDCRRRLR